LRELHRRLSVDRVVLVQPSVYGSDNRCLLQAIQEYGAGQARGVAVLDLAATADQDLEALHAAGIRGVRLNLHVSGSGLDAARRELAQAACLRTLPGWHVQVHAGLDMVASLLVDFRRLEMPVVLDHHAGGLVPDPESEEALAQLLGEMRYGHLYVKLSAPYRLTGGAGLGHASRLAREFQAAAPDRVLWGSDWPHTGGTGRRDGRSEAIEPFRAIDNAQVLADLLACMPDDDARHRLLVRNPAALYGFDATSSQRQGQP
jgi:predicted TIM-barrel fold metal-dependent hydrolase